jgi:hypothetical protein
MKQRRKNLENNYQRCVDGESLRGSKPIFFKNNFSFYLWKKRLKREKTIFKSFIRTDIYYYHVWKKRRKKDEKI